MKKEMYDELYRTEQVHFFSCAKREITEALRCYYVPQFA